MFALNKSRFLIRPATSLIRLQSTIGKDIAAKIYNYESIKKLSQNLPANTVLVDVREPVEFNEVHIPNAINIPYKSCPGALGLSPEEFEDFFSFPKPDPSKELIFYCKAGVRSTGAEELAKTFGYDKRGNYTGSMDDWMAHEKK